MTKKVMNFIPMINRRDALQQFGTAIVGSMSLGMATAEEKSQSSQAKSPRPRIKIGQIGVGHAHAMRTLLTHRESKDFEVVGIVEPNEELRKKAESNPAYKDLRWMTQEQLLNEKDLQAVLVETEVGNLLDAAEASVKAGKHVHIDKPAGESLPQFKRILDSAARQKLCVQMGYVYRNNPGVLLVHELLKQGWLGEVFEIHAVMSEVNTPEKRKQLAQYPGGIFFELGGHITDVVVGIMGKPEKVTSFIQHVSPLEDKLVDNMLAVLSYPRALATLKSSSVEVEGNKRRHLTVCGTEGTIHIQPIDSPSARLTLSKARGKYKEGTQEIILPKFSRYITEAAEFARVIREIAEPAYSYEHDLNVQSTLLQVCQLPLDK